MKVVREIIQEELNKLSEMKMTGIPGMDDVELLRNQVHKLQVENTLLENFLQKVEDVLYRLDEKSLIKLDFIHQYVGEYYES